MAPADPRPALDDALERLLEDLVRRLEPLSGLDVSTLLPVALSAHGVVAASVRSLDDVASGVVIAGRRRRVELGLRPPFFLGGDAARRLGTLVHELLHLDPARPGQLLEARRHRNRSHEEHEAEAEALARRWLEEADLTLLAPLGHDGEVLVRQWRVRPVAETAGRAFFDADVFLGPVRMRTPKGRRTVWW